MRTPEWYRVGDRVIERTGSGEKGADSVVKVVSSKDGIITTSTGNTYDRQGMRFDQIGPYRSIRDITRIAKPKKAHV